MCLWLPWVCIRLQVIDSDVMAGEWFEYDMGCMILLCSLLFGVISRFISCWTSLQHTDSQSAPWEMNLANAGLNMQVSAPVMSGWGASEAMLNIWIRNVSGLRTMNIWGESRKHVLQQLGDTVITQILKCTMNTLYAVCIVCNTDRKHCFVNVIDPIVNYSCMQVKILTL